MADSFLMQAVSDDDGELYTWTATSKDWAATGFPGPGSALYVAVAEGRIAAGSVADGSITTAKLANDAVTASKIADDAVQLNHIFENAVRTFHIAPGNVTTDTIADGAVTAAKIAEGAIFSNTTASGGNPALTVAPATAAAFASLANTGARTYDYDPGVDGYYTLVYEFRLVVGGSYRKVAASQDFKRVAGVCSLEGSTVTSGLGVQTGVAVAFSISSDDVRVTLTNSTGGALTGHYWRSVLSGDLPT